MSSRLKGDSILFTMMLLLPQSNGQIKIQPSIAAKRTLGQVWSKFIKISDSLGFVVKTWKMLFCYGFDQF